MKTFLISATITILTLILIVFFQNLAGSFNGVWILFYKFTPQDPAALGVFLIEAMGFIAGVLTTMLAIVILNGNNQEEPGGVSW